MAERPPRDEAEEGSFAIRVDGPANIVYRYDTGSPFRSQPSWHRVDEYDSTDALPMNLRGAEFGEDEDEMTWVFARHVEAEGQLDRDREGPNSGRERGTSERTETDQTDWMVVGQYGVEFGDGESVSASSQADAMASTVDAMIENYGLLQRIELPYMSGYKNALINTRPRHPDGREMEGHSDLSGGCYVQTKLSAKQKKEYIRELAEIVGVEVAFTGSWGGD